MKEWLKKLNERIKRDTAFVENAVKEQWVCENKIIIDEFDERYYDHLFDFVYDIIWAMENLVDSGVIRSYSFTYDGLKYVFEIYEFEKEKK